MDRPSAIKIVQRTFNSPFDKGRFVHFVRELFNAIDESPFIYRGNFIPDAYDPYIRTFERIGKYQDVEGNKIDILIVQLKKESSLEHARTMQRNFVAWYLNGSRGGELKDAAVAAFVAPNSEDWRFSLVKMEYRFAESKDGKINPKQELTPARRWSFLVGRNENSHTAQKQLLPILQDDQNDPLLSQLESAFSVEVVTKEFFEKYRELFLKTKESLDEIIKKDSKIATDFKEKDIDTANFAKKLLGQIVFLYFLQKKGWFGVPRSKDWGEGDKKFLRNLFIRAKTEGKNYFNDYLEPLFYQALRYDRSADDDYFSQFDCKIPFLNGGLFDPMGNYYWVDTDILLPDDIFSNERKTKEGDTGDGILDIFDRYNFTVKEDEPLEKEVAVDPEMLGKVFENLLEVKDRKSKGTYYTPREIVHYMCQESLANYLATELSFVIPSEARNLKKDIETLIKYGETSVEHDAIYIEKKSKNADYRGRYDQAKLPKSIEKYAKLIDEKLETIRVCDPAVGSGAFLVGMMNEIIRTRNALTPYINKDGERTPYNFKRHAIQNCLYSVDIDSGAVEIAKLRLWLSLIVDEEERETIQPLPNLDYKIVQGNSLIELLSPEFLSTSTDHKRIELVQKLKKAKDELFVITSPSEKTLKRKAVDDLIKRLFKYDKDKATEKLKQEIVAIRSRQRLFDDKKLERQDQEKIKNLENKIKELENIKVPGPSEHFEWHIYFSEVFQEKKGFDVVIANPPYINVNEMKREAELYRNLYTTPFGSYDIYILFFEKSITILREKGVLTYITSNKYFIADYAKKLRHFIVNNTRVLILLDLADCKKVFEHAFVSPAITILQKEKTNNYKFELGLLKDRDIYDIDEIKLSSLDITDLAQEPNNVFDIYSDDKNKDILKKLDIDSKPLSQVADVRTGVMGFEYWEMEPFIKKGQQAGYIRIITNGQIDKYAFVFDKKLNLYKKTFFNSYLDVKKAPINENTKQLFLSKKIIIRGVAKRLSAQFDDKGFGVLVAVHTAIPKKSEYNPFYLLALINSILFNWYHLTKFYTARIPMGSLKYPISFLKQLPIKSISACEQKPFIDLVDKIIAITKDSNYLQNPTKQAKVRDYERKIDQMVYKLYSLTDEEINIVEDASGSTAKPHALKSTRTNASTQS